MILVYLNHNEICSIYIWILREKSHLVGLNFVGTPCTLYCLMMIEWQQLKNKIKILWVWWHEITACWNHSMTTLTPFMTILTLFMPLFLQRLFLVRMVTAQFTRMMYVNVIHHQKGVTAVRLEALSHLAGSALYTYIASPYTKICYQVAKSPVRQKMYASQECICNEHRLTRTHLADNNRT